MITSIYIPKNKQHVIEDASTLAQIRDQSLSELIIDLLTKETSKYPRLLEEMREYKKHAKA